MEHDRIRVLQLIKSLDRGGAERLLTHMVVGGDPRFAHDVAFVRTDMQELVPDLESAGITVHDLGVTGDFDLAWLPRLRRLLLANRYDVMHAHSPYAAGLARLVTRTLRPAQRPRLVCTEHSLWTHDRMPSRVLGRTTSRWDDVRIAVAETNRAAMPASIRRRTRVIRHGIPLDELARQADPANILAPLDIPAGHQVVLTVANLKLPKGYPTLLAAARELVDSGLPVTFLAAGSGPIEADLRAEHARLGLGDRFRFLGQRSDAPALIAASDLVVLPSDWECMPVSVMEAFALGTPLVATTVGELPLVITSGVNGILVPPGDPRALAAAIRRVLLDADLRTSLAAAGRAASEQFDVRTTQHEVESVYAEVLAR